MGTTERGLIPNSFQMPNLYVDRAMDLLTGEEFKVLTYAVRRIFGFNKREDQISLSQFVGGVRAHDGTQLDRGTGLSRPTIVSCLESLTGFGLLVCTHPGDVRLNQAAAYALQLDDGAIDWDGLEERDREASIRRQAQAARQERPGKPVVLVNAVNQPGKPGKPALVNPVNQDLVNPVYPHYPVETQKVPRGEDPPTPQPQTAAHEQDENPEPAPPIPTADFAAGPASGYFANPNGFVTAADPAAELAADPARVATERDWVQAVEAALFDYCLTIPRPAWVQDVLKLCELHAGRGTPVTVELLQQAAADGREAWLDEGKTGPPKFLNCFTDALAAALFAGATSETCGFSRWEWDTMPLHHRDLYRGIYRDEQSQRAAARGTSRGLH